MKDPYNSLFEIVCSRINSWENNQPEIKAFKAELALLRTPIDQYQLATFDFTNEIGNKSMISLLLRGERQH